MASVLRAQYAPLVRTRPIAAPHHIASPLSGSQCIVRLVFCALLAHLRRAGGVLGRTTISGRRRTEIAHRPAALLRMDTVRVGDFVLCRAAFAVAVTDAARGCERILPTASV